MLKVIIGIVLLLVIVLVAVQFFVFPVFEEATFFSVFGRRSFDLSDEVHPVLLYTKPQLVNLKRNLNREPYNSIYSYVHSKCDEYLSENIEDEREKALASKFLSFCYAVEGKEEYAEKAESLIMQIDEHKFRNIVSDYNYGLVFASQAYDMLKGAGWKFSDEKRVRSKIKNMVLLRANTPLLAFYYPYDIPGLLSFFNNHELRKQSTLGIASIALANESESQQLFKSSQYGFSRIVLLQSSGMGVWGEGPNYFSYSMLLAFPYLRAINNYYHTNVMNSLDRQVNWAFNLTMNDGKIPNFDDSSYSYIIYPLFDSENSRKYNSLWKKFQYGKKGEFSVDLLFSDFYSDSYSFPELIVMNHTGAVFRVNNTYLLFLAEDGVASTNYAHEHPDGLSIILQRNNDVLIHDSGYWALDGNSSERRPWLVNKDINHNVILVDGKGQPEKYWLNPIESIIKGILGLNKDTEAYLLNSSVSSHFVSATAFSRYSDAYVERKVVAVNKQYYVLFDKAISEHKRAYSLLFHTGAENVLISNTSASWDDFKLISNYPIKSFEQLISVNHYARNQNTLNITTSGDLAYFITILCPNEKPKSYKIIKEFGYQAIVLEFNGFKDVIVFNQGDSFNLYGLSSKSTYTIYRVKNGKILFKYEE